MAYVAQVCLACRTGRYRSCPAPASAVTAVGRGPPELPHCAGYASGCFGSPAGVVDPG
jgi:hypothetical protein